MTQVSSVSWLRVGFLVAGVLSLPLLTVLFGGYGFIVALFFLLLVAVAK
jgi:nitrate reductase NapE component